MQNATPVHALELLYRYLVQPQSPLLLTSTHVLLNKISTGAVAVETEALDVETMMAFSTLSRDFTAVTTSWHLLRRYRRYFRIPFYALRLHRLVTLVMVYREFRAYPD